MSIRLSKALSELNIGLQTAVEFLEKRNDVGDEKLGPTSKLSDAQYSALVEAFKQDAAVRTEAEKLFQKKPKEKKHSSETKDSNTESLLASSGKQEYKPLGKIDLDSIGKPAAKQSGATKKNNTPQPKAVAVSQVKDTNTVEAKTSVAPAAPQPKPAETKTAQHTNEVKPAMTENKEPQKHVKPAAEAKPKHDKPAQPKHDKNVAKQPKAQEKPATEQPTAESGSKVFQLKSEKKMLNTPKVNVLGKIDLDALNQSTRPKKKSKEEKRREREEKAQQNGERKKRVRINKERVDISAASNQGGNGGNGGNKNNGNNANNQGKKKKNRNRQQKPLEVNEVDVAKQVKETLARLTQKQNQNKKGAKYRKEKREAVQEKLNAEAKAERKESKTLKLTEFVTVSELATMMNVGVNQVIGTLMGVGIMVSINQRLDAETINLVADEFGFKTEYVSAEVQEAVSEEEDDEADLVARAPIVTVMGHVDHGKTSLLDHIRNTNVIAGEAGGITQHIGAYNVKLKNGRRITFLDTPGHEAFTAMRARGAKVTDIVIIIVAADDAVMPQTVEALNHASAAGVPIIFAINKIDKPGANPDKIKEELANLNYLVEEWGGKYQSQDISAKKGIGVAELLDKVLLEADMLELKANPHRKATGSIIESSLDKGRGYVATLLVDNGTLHVGDIILAGTHYGKVKAMFNERNQRIQEAGPSSPALILGLNGAPTAGDKFNVMDTDQEARQIANKREQLQRELGLRTQKRFTLEDIARRKALGEFHELNVIVKGDVDGSIEALSDSLLKLSTPEVQVNVVHKAVGAISESDVTLAAASNAYIIGFQVRPSADAKRLAAQEGVDIRIYSIIYDAIEEVKSAMEGMLAPDIKEEVIGNVMVKEVYHISKVGTIAGAMVMDGKIKRNCKVRVIRDGIVRYTGALASLKRFKDDVKEVTNGFECGLSIAGYNDILPDDMLEAFEEVEVQKSL